MKKSLFVLAIVLVLGVAASLPPQLPSSFYGEITGAAVGARVTTNYSGYTTAFAWQGKVVYTLNVTGGTEGAAVTFYINGVKSGTAVYHVGTNQNIPLIKPVAKCYWWQWWCR